MVSHVPNSSAVSAARQRAHEGVTAKRGAFASGCCGDCDSLTAFIGLGSVPPLVSVCTAYRTSPLADKGKRPFWYQRGEKKTAPTPRKLVLWR